MAQASSFTNFNAAIASKRKEKDVMKLMMSDYKVERSSENPNDIVVEFDGPKDSFYEGGKWHVHVILPDAYPYKSPSIGFSNRIFHPNVDEMSGSVCLDVINQTWSPMFDLVNIFEVFLPQLLMYPNPTDPLNPEAAAIMLKDPERYEERVKDGVEKYAKPYTAETNQSNKQKTMGNVDDDMDVEDATDDDNEDDQVSMDGISELSETSDITLFE